MKFRKYFSVLLMLTLIGCQKEKGDISNLSGEDVGKICVYLFQQEDESFDGVMMVDIKNGFRLLDEEVLNRTADELTAYGTESDTDFELLKKASKRCHISGGTVLKNFHVDDMENAVNISTIVNKLDLLVGVRSGEKEFKVKLPVTMSWSLKHQETEPDREHISMAADFEGIFDSFNDEEFEITHEDVLGEGGDYRFYAHSLSADDKAYGNGIYINEPVIQFNIMLKGKDQNSYATQPAVTLIRYKLTEMDDDGIVDLPKVKTFKELRPYIYYEDADDCYVDINSLLYGYDDFRNYLYDIYESNIENLDLTRLDEVLSELKEKIIQRLEK